MGGRVGEAYRVCLIPQLVAALPRVYPQVVTALPKLFDSLFSPVPVLYEQRRYRVDSVLFPSEPSDCPDTPEPCRDPGRAVRGVQHRGLGGAGG